MNTPTNLPAQNPTGFAAGDRVSNAESVIRKAHDYYLQQGRYEAKSSAKAEWERRKAARGTVTGVKQCKYAWSVQVDWDDGTKSDCLSYLLAKAPAPVAVAYMEPATAPTPALPQPTPPVMLSTGRMIVHTRLANGAEGATPNKGPAELTEAEWAEYTQLILTLTDDELAAHVAKIKASGDPYCVTEHRP